MGTLTHIMEQQSSNSDLNSSIDERTLKIIFKIKRYYIICVWNRRNIDFNISETVAKNIIIYRTFDKKS